MSRLTPKEVEAYLRQHLDFFEGRDSLLLSMRVPHGSKGSISLVEKQLALLREGQRGSKAQLDALYASATRNLTLFDKSRRLTLALIAAGDRQAFLAALDESLLRDFGCQMYRLVVFGEAGESGHAHTLLAAKAEAKRAGAHASPGKPRLGPLAPAARDFLFGTQGKRVQSALTLALDGRGLLAIGGEGAEDFTPDLDTLFIGFAAEVLARLLPKHFAEGRAGKGQGTP